MVMICPCWTTLASPLSAKGLPAMGAIWAAQPEQRIKMPKTNVRIATSLVGVWLPYDAAAVRFIPANLGRRGGHR
jgi:hypothetical protein